MVSLRLGQVAALTAHRAVIHYRSLRFATLPHRKRYGFAANQCENVMFYDNYQQLRPFLHTGGS